MQSPLRITFRGMGHSPAIEARVREKAKVFERFHEFITSCDVIVESPHQHQRKGRIYAVRVEMRLPDSALIVNTERQNNPAHEDVYVAIRDAFSAVTRQLDGYVRKTRGRVKWHAVPNHGRVVRIYHDEGFGFVESREGVEVYFHENAVPDGAFQALAIGDEVRLVVAEGEGVEGPQASAVVPIGKHHLLPQRVEPPPLT